MGIWLVIVSGLALFSALTQAAVLPHIREKFRDYPKKHHQIPDEKRVPDLTKDTAKNKVIEMFEGINKTNARHDKHPTAQERQRHDIDIIGFERKLDLSDAYVYHITKHRGNESRFAVEYLWRYGYLMDDMTLITRHTLVRALRNFQRRSNITQTGTITDETITEMRQPRCGNKDGDGRDSLSRRQKRYLVEFRNKNNRTEPYRWTKRYITYKVLNYTANMKPEDVDEEVRLAFERWSNVTTLVFEHTTCNDVDIRIEFGRRKHSDCDAAFDGSGGQNNVLAHAFRPGNCPLCGDMHFDDDETWTNEIAKAYGPSRAIGNPAMRHLQWGTISFANAATHELGHSIGLQHSDIYEAMMFKRYRVIPNYDLEQDDLDGVHFLYGNKSNIYTAGDENDGPLDVRCIKPRPGYAHASIPGDSDDPEDEARPGHLEEQGHHNDTDTAAAGCITGHMTITRVVCVVIVITSL